MKKFLVSFFLIVVIGFTGTQSWVDRLAKFESQNTPIIKKLDKNGKYSYGCLQFQKRTFDSVSKRYKLEGNIYDCEFQRKLATKMIEEDPNNCKHWKAAVRAIGKPDK